MFRRVSGSTTAAAVAAGLSLPGVSSGNLSTTTFSISPSSSSLLQAEKSNNNTSATTNNWMQTRHFGGDMQHYNSDVNHTRIPWDFTMESYAKIEEIMLKFPRSQRRSGVMPLLHIAQTQQGGYIPVTAMYKIAKICEVPPMRVFETVTFYAMFNRKPVGKYHVQFCITTPCMLEGCDDLIYHACTELGVKMNGTTKDGCFTLGEMECMGCCVNAPMICVSDYSNAPNFSYDYYEDLTCETMMNVLNNLRDGKPVTRGPQCGTRRNGAPKGGKTTLLFDGGLPPGPWCRDLTPKPVEAKK